MKNKEVEDLKLKVKNLEKQNQKMRAYAETVEDIMSDTATLEDYDGHAFEDFDTKSVYFALLRNLTARAKCIGESVTLKEY